MALAKCGMLAKDFSMTAASSSGKVTAIWPGSVRESPSEEATMCETRQRLQRNAGFKVSTALVRPRPPSEARRRARAATGVPFGVDVLTASP